ncbi:site-specific integrase [Tsukamurella soli]
MPCGYVTLDRRFHLGACDLEHLTLHDLRRTGNTIAAVVGATLGEMKQLLRHRTSEAAERYIVAARGADAALARRISEPAVNPLRSSGRGTPVDERVAVLDAAVIATAIESSPT